MGSVITRRTMLSRSAAAGGGLAVASSPFAAFAQRAHAQGGTAGYGAPVPKPPLGGVDPSQQLALPPEFEYVVLDVQGLPMRDGQPTPGIFDGMAAFRGRRGSTVLIRNHENREQAGEQKVVTGSFEYDPLTQAGNTKVVVRRNGDGLPEKAESFAVLGGTSTNCAGGEMPWGSWVAGEEVVKRTANGLKHGYIFEVPSEPNGPVRAVPVPAAGRFAHEAVAYLDGILYETEDRNVTDGGSAFYRYIPRRSRFHGHDGGALGTRGRLEALKLKDEDRANMDSGRVVGKPYRVEWVEIDEPDHDDDTDQRRDRVPGFTPTRFQAQDRGAAIFDRTEGIWVGSGDGWHRERVYFDCTTGGALNLGQVWEYDPRRRTITLLYESTDAALLENPDNVVVVPHTGDIFLQEDSDGEQFIRGLTPEGEIYDFARTVDNDTEFCGGCFDPRGDVFYVNQQGERGTLPDGPPDGRAVTYAIVGPFEDRARR